MDALNLFSEPDISVPKTEGLKYAGSKLKILPHLLSLIAKVQPKTVLDAFSGTTRVSQALAQKGYTVIANDCAVWSEVFGNAYLLNDLPAGHYRPIVEHLNNLRPVEGWFTEHYGGDNVGGRSVGSDGQKKPWQKHNTRRLDAIREEIDRLQLSPVERAVLLTSLLLALDKVDSTIGHFSSYLSKWSARSYKPLTLEVPRLINSGSDHLVYRSDALALAPTAEVDLAYFDPPYGSNNDKMPPSRVRYAAYYHCWTSVCLNDRPNLFGKVNRRNDSSDKVAASVFEDFRRGSSGRFRVVDAIEQLIRTTRAKYVMLSYSSGGRATAEELADVISSNGSLLDVIEFDYRRNVMAGMRWTNDWVREAETPNREFIFLMEKGS